MKKAEKRRLVGSVVLAFGVAALLLYIPFWQVSGDLQFVMWIAGIPFICGVIIGILSKRHTVAVTLGFPIIVVVLIVVNSLWSKIDFEWWVPSLMFVSWIASAVFGGVLVRWLA